METHTLDASKESLGRLASKAAMALMGKMSPSFAPHRVSRARVIVRHSDALVFTGKKWTQKRYFRHSGYIGHLKTLNAGQMRDRDSREIVRLAVLGMLPKNKLRRERIKNLIIYRGEAPEERST